jgi:hypothetical protein
MRVCAVLPQPALPLLVLPHEFAQCRLRYKSETTTSTAARLLFSCVAIYHVSLTLLPLRKC